MESKEFGLLFVQKMLNLEHLHYGLHSKGEKLNFDNFKNAQQKYSNFLISHIEKAVKKNRKASILDVGCGFGSNLKILKNKNYNIQGLVPSKTMAQHSKKVSGAKVYCDMFENFDARKKYDLVFFSESYQYVDIDQSFKQLEKILKKDGKIVICDFFVRDNSKGLSKIGGGHKMGLFYEKLKNTNYKIHTEIDITENIISNIDFMNEVINDRVISSAKLLDEYMMKKQPLSYKIFKFAFKNRLNKIAHKSDKARNGKNFGKDKVYKLIVLK